MSAIYKDGTLYPTGGSGSSGHTILDNTGTSLTDEPNLKFGGDFEVSDDSENDETEVAPHRLTSEELADICSPLPASTANLPVLFDESGAEYVVGKYVNSQGKWKPVYQKIIEITSLTNGNWVTYQHNIQNADTIFIENGFILSSSGQAFTMGYRGISMYADAYATSSEIGLIESGMDASKAVITLQYTKSTDTYQD